MYKFKTFIKEKNDEYIKSFENNNSDIDIYPIIITEGKGISDYLKSFPDYLIKKFI